MPSLPDWAALDQALDRALALEGSEREAFLASLDGAIREALTPLLHDALREDSFLDRPEAVLASLYEDDGRLDERRIAKGARIGPYQIEALVGEGGMGRVFRAHRVDGAFDQTVAVKVVRTSLALAGSDVADRLRRERKVLASLDHPCIARLLDGGETDDGVPYLVTEFIDGAEITTWAEDRALDVKARVRLLIEVARAVDHAHRRFIVHCDLKPSNVLVTERDGAARPVVLDFGIAKLLDAAEWEGTHGFPLTRTGLRLLTPAYAAPELFEPTATVTTAADVYGLGALLYELLTGRRPHDDTAASGPPTAEVIRPSKAVTLPTTATVATAASDPAQRARALRGDLDTICLKALHPEPDRRYASAAALADDLARYLDGHPVEARPDSLAYVAGRFARRHRVALAAAVVALIGLVGGLGVALVALGNEREARAEAEAAATRATEAADLLAGLFRMSNPDYDDGRAVTLLEAVEEGVRQAGAVESDPLRAYLLRVLGETYIDLGEPAIADSLLQAALALYGEDAVSGEATKIRLSLALTRNALADPARTLALGQRVYRDHRNDADLGTALFALRLMSRAYSRLGQHNEAIEAAERARALLGPEGSASERMLMNAQLGQVLSAAGRIAESIPYLEETLQQSVQVFGRASGETSRALANLGYAKGRLGEIEAAEALLGEAIAFHAQRYGAHRVGYPLAHLGEARLRAGRFRQAAAALDSAVTMAGPIIGMDHPDIGHWLTLQATAHNGYGAYEEAERAARRALAIAQTPGWEQALAQLGVALRGQGRDQEAGTLTATSDAP
jgi:serine/threonine-protein kinase